MKNKFMAIIFFIFVGMLHSSAIAMEADPFKVNLRLLKNNLVVLHGKLGCLRGKLVLLKIALNKPYLTIVNGELIKQSFPEKKCAAIVNAANGGLLGGGGIDGIIWGAVAQPDSNGLVGTEQFSAQCHVLRRKKAKAKTDKIENQWCGYVGQESVAQMKESDYNTGEAGIIQAFGKLSDNVGYVIQAVGPVGVQPELLRNAYQNSLNRAADAKLKVIAFCPISTGIFGYDINLATPVVIKAIVDWINSQIDNHSDSSIEEIRLVTWDGKPVEYDTYKEKLQADKSLEEITADAKSVIDKQLLDKSTSKSKLSTTPPLVFCVKKN